MSWEYEVVWEEEEVENNCFALPSEKEKPEGFLFTTKLLYSFGL